MKIDKAKLKLGYENACNEYLKAFLKKHGYGQDYCYWVADEVGGIAEIGDYFVSMETIITDIDWEVPEEEFLKWYDYCLETGFLGCETPSYKSWIRGFPVRTSEEIAEMNAKQKQIEDLKQELEIMIKKEQK